MSKMRAIQYDSYGPPEVLQMRSVPVPIVRTGHVLVRVAASSVNAADVLVRSGKLKILSGRSFPRGTGFDFTGDIAEIGRGVKDYKVGDGVWGFINGLKQPISSTAADYVLAPLSAISLRPVNIATLEAAALPGAGGAALKVLRDIIRLQPNETILIRGASGGVGVAAIQIARSLGGRVTAMVRKEHIELARGLGAERALDYRTVRPQDLGRFDVILDPVAKRTWDFRPLLSPNGRMVTMTIGSFADAFYMAASVVFGKRRVRFAECPPNHAILKSLTDLVNSKTVAPVATGIYSVEEIAAAHSALEAGGGFGKRVVQQY